MEFFVMKEPTNVEAGSLSIATFKVNRLTMADGKVSEVPAEYNLVMDFNALAKARKEIGREFTDPNSWSNLDTDQLSALCWCAFLRFHPEVSLEEVRGMLPPAARSEIWMMLMELCFPGAAERIEKAAAAAAADDQVGPSPNPPAPTS